MHSRVHLRAPPPIVIPLNYAHQLASVIYRLLDRSSSVYASFLYGYGYGTSDRRSNLFTFTGPPELLRIGYVYGFGDRNSQGFGMVEVARQATTPAP